MPFHIDNANAPAAVVTLEGEVTIAEAQQLAADLASAHAVTVDASALADIDTCILQLLVSLQQTLPDFSIRNPSPAFTSMVDRCGLGRNFHGRH